MSAWLNPKMVWLQSGMGSIVVCFEHDCSLMCQYLCWFDIRLVDVAFHVLFLTLSMVSGEVGMGRGIASLLHVVVVVVARCQCVRQFPCIIYFLFDDGFNWSFLLDGASVFDVLFVVPHFHNFCV